MIIITKDHPTFDQAKLIIDNAKFLDFSELPVKGMGEWDAMVKSGNGLLPWIADINNEQSTFYAECTVGSFINNLIEYYKDPYDFDQPFQIADFFKPRRLTKEEFDHWLPVYQYAKHKNNLL